jgi:hypothetical protein
LSTREEEEDHIKASTVNPNQSIDRTSLGKSPRTQEQEEQPLLFNLLKQPQHLIKHHQLARRSRASKSNSTEAILYTNNHF